MSELDELGEAEIVLDPAEVADVERWAADEGVTVVPVEQHGFEPIATATLLIFGTLAAVAAVQHRLEQRRGGQVIDVRGATPRFYRDPGLQFGLVTVIAHDGTATVEVKEPKGMLGPLLEALQGTMTGLGKAGISAVGEAVKQAAGSSEVTITVA